MASIAATVAPAPNVQERAVIEILLFRLLLRGSGRFGALSRLRRCGRRLCRLGRRRAGVGLGAAADGTVGGKLLLHSLLELGRGGLRGAAAAGAAARADGQHVDGNAADVRRDANRDLGVHRDVRLVDVEIEREIVQHVRQIDVDQRRYGGRRAGDGLPRASDAICCGRSGLAPGSRKKKCDCGAARILRINNPSVAAP